MTDARIPMRTRFAPSPTGPLHFGSVRTALFAWLAARHSGGRFVLRIEDTDQERYLEDSEALIMETLLWLGLRWDEGPEVGGPHGPYVQSQRTDTYREHAEVLVERGAAYWCTCSEERLAEMRERQRAARQPTRYDRRCLARQQEVVEERAAGRAAVLRQLIAPGRTTWIDLVRGEISFDNADIDDQVLLKSDGFPTYHLAVVVDDHLMEITHVIRSDEWIPSTPKHLGLYSAFDWAPPSFAHVPPVLGEDRQKLSKRRGARNVLEYGELGYLAPAVVNAMALLGWSSGTEEELFTPPELVERFTLERVNVSAAVFESTRLDSLNGQHIRRLPVEELVELLEFWLPGTSKETRRRLVPLLQERMVLMSDARILAGPLLGDAPWDDDVAFPPRKVDKDTAIVLLDDACGEVEGGGLEDPTAM
ncbi:MAG TPA: glutamate--tRNA ligase, partial [Candidatus Deferrimicrobium sp.]|nr:glutamate--tRNA ligase [Candidatus Deferrimicrobium sp.]